MRTLSESVSCRLLQRLLEAAWDEGDTQRLLELSQALDQHTVEAINRHKDEEMAI